MFVGLALLTVASTPAGASKCDAARIRAAGALGKVSLACHAKSARRGEAVADDCLALATERFAKRYAKATQKADCTQPLLDDASVASSVATEITAIAAAQRPEEGASSCAAHKITAAGTGTAGLAQCDAVSVTKGLPVDAQCVADAQTKLELAFGKVESKDPTCLTTGDAASVASAVGNLVDIVDAKIYEVPATPTNTPINTGTATSTATGTNTPTFTPTVTGTATATNTVTVTPGPPFTGTTTPTVTPTPVPCSLSAPVCGGPCRFPGQVCQSNGAGGCQCFDIFMQ